MGRSCAGNRGAGNVSDEGIGCFAPPAAPPAAPAEPAPAAADCAATPPADAVPEPVEVLPVVVVDALLELLLELLEEKVSVEVVDVEDFELFFFHLAVRVISSVTLFLLKSHFLPSSSYQPLNVYPLRLGLEGFVNLLL